jgi:hypothetical protein
LQGRFWVEPKRCAAPHDNCDDSIDWQALASVQKELPLREIPSPHHCAPRSRIRTSP